MSTSRSSTQDPSRSARDDKRRKRRERSARSRSPEPKDIVSGAGQPLDPGVRRELEEQLGHDFSRVRLHTDRDSAHLADVMGADAFAVGQDIFFREGTYRPGTADGQRLLAHELLHTVQNPHGLGALRAGRDLGSVSLPQESVEREAESAAQESVLGALRDSVRTEEPAAAEIEEGQATPGWLRYATVDADRMRLEQIDPATLVDRMTNGIVRSLRGDPEDLSGRVRTELARMAPELQDSVLDRLEVRLLSPEYERLLDLTAQAEAAPLGLQPLNVPEPVPDAIDLIEDERQTRAARTEGEKKSAAARDEDTKAEKKDAKGRDGEREQEQTRAQQDASAEEKESGERKAQEDERAEELADSKKEQQQEAEKQGEEREKADQADAERAQEGQEGSERAKEERKEQREREEQDPEQANRPGADKRKRKDDEKKPADGAKQEELDKKKKEQPGPARPEKVDERADQRDSALSEHGLHEKDEDEGEPREEERPLGLEAGAEKEVDGGQEEKHGGGSGKGEAELKPEDHLPEADPDLSSVPTAENPTASMPSFPAPPPTKAEKVQKARENDADEEEDEDAPEAETKAPGAERGPVEGEAPQPEHGPASEAPDRSEKDLQPEKPVEQEVGPDPEAEEQRDPEQEAEGKKDPEQQQDQDEDGAKAARQDAADKDAERDEDSGGGEGAPDAKEAQDEQQDKKDQDEREEKQEAKGQPEGAAADKPTGAPGSGAAGPGSGPAASSLAPPAGAHTERTAVEDRHPSPAARRGVGPVRSENEAPAPKSAVPKEAGPGAAPSGTVGANEPAAQPKAAAGPGGAPSVAQAAVSPVGEQAENPGKMGAPAPEGAKAQPDASLEKDGGGCAPPEPAAEKEEKGGSCGGGGGGEKAAEEKKEEPPDVSGQDPKAALSTVSKLSPDQAQAAMPGVDTAADKKVDQEQKRLQANPPKRERPSGAPQTQSSAPEAEAPETAVSGKLEKVGPEDQGEKQRAKGSEKAQGAKPTDNIKAPQLPPTKDGKLTQGDAKSVEAAADKVPTTDPELRNKTVGPAPKIKLEGESDPKRTDKQAEKLKDKQGKIQDTGRADASKPMGEDKIFPNAPKEQLTGKASGRAGGGGGRQSAGGGAKQHVGVVAKQERGGELKSGAAQSQTDMSAKEKEHQQGEQQAKQEKQQEIDNEVARNAEQQTAERGRAAEQAGKERQSWRDEQDKKIEKADKDTEKEHKDGNKKITKERDDKDKEVEGRKNDDNKDIDTKAEQAEKDAEKKKEEKKGESDSLFGKILDAVGDFFKGLLDAVTAIFDAARNAINSVIDKFKEFANKAIDAVRDFAIKAINVLADALIAIGDVLLAAFPELRDKFRKAIEGLRDAAINTVNKLADGLKKAVNTLLDALAAGLNKLLDVLEAGVKAVIKAYQAVITAAIKFAEAAIEALGKFAALVADIAPDPGGWLKGAGSAAKTGIQEHLWGAIKSAVKQWFDTKVEGILGLGKAVINVLVKGCMSVKQIGKMAWDAIVASLPMMIASLVIEKVVSMIIPAAGAILTIVQGLMAAWESISSILTAFSKFFAYLKAVKAGPAACLFAEAVAAGVVALLDFITNFLLQRLGRATKGVGKRLKAMAQKITAGLKKTGKGARKAAGKAVNAAKGAARKAAQALRKPARPTKPKGPRVPDRPGASTDRKPGGGAPKHQPKTHPTGRPTSKTPDPAKKKHDDEAEAKKTKDEAASPKKPQDKDTSNKPQDKTPDKDGPSRKPDRDGADAKKDRTPDKDGPDKKSGKDDAEAKKDKKPDKPSKKKETEAPKRAKPRKPKSPLGQALKKIKGKVKSALKKVRNAGKVLGKKLRKSKVGKALKSTAKRTRDFFKKKRNQLRDNKKHKHDQKKQKNEERKKKENSKESKSARLEKIARRIRPKLNKILDIGVPRPVMQMTLAGMRLWYRLTGLDLSGRDSGNILGRLNPEVRVVPFETKTAPENLRVTAERMRQRKLEQGDEEGRRRQQDPDDPKALSPELKAILSNPPEGEGKRRHREGPRRRRGLPPRDVARGESLSYKKASKRGVKDDDLTPDHIPSGAAVIQAARMKAVEREQEKLGRRMTDEEIHTLLDRKQMLDLQIVNDNGKKRKSRQETAEKIYQNAMTVMVDEELHEVEKGKKGSGSRSWGSRNTKRQGRGGPKLYDMDARDLTTATEDDFRWYLVQLHARNRLPVEQVFAFIVHYKRLTDRKVIEYSRDIDRMLLHYWEIAKRAEREGTSGRN
ncbi:eCIS core domain-containing protein [Streptomyces nigrescens]|uniref:eCIS core domain-containing protein n=1 Tax=Streptomyces nigrescens TaxID=1920 RepID=UPI0036FB9B49